MYYQNLKLQVTPTQQGDLKVSIDLQVSVLDAGRGNWRSLGELGRVFIFEGFNTENRLMVLFEMLQDATIDVTLVSSQVDCCAKIYNERLPRPLRSQRSAGSSDYDSFLAERDAKRITEWLNARIQDLDL